MAKKIENIYKSYLNGSIHRVDLDRLLHYFDQASDEELEALTSLTSNDFEEDQIEQPFASHIEIIKGRLEDKIYSFKTATTMVGRRFHPTCRWIGDLVLFGTRSKTYRCHCTFSTHFIC